MDPCDVIPPPDLRSKAKKTIYKYTYKDRMVYVFWDIFYYVVVVLIACALCFPVVYVAHTFWIAFDAPRKMHVKMMEDDEYRSQYIAEYVSQKLNRESRRR